MKDSSQKKQQTQTGITKPVKMPSNVKYLCWNITKLSVKTSFKSIRLTNFTNSGCLLVKIQPMWAKKNPRRMLCGSAFVSLYLWCKRWTSAQSCKECKHVVECKRTSKALSFLLALKDWWETHWCAPTVIPNPPIKTMMSRTRWVPYVLDDIKPKTAAMWR